MDTKTPDEPPITIVAQERLMLACWHIGRGRSFEETAALVGIPIYQLRPIMNYFGIRGRNVGKGARRLDVVIPSDAQELIRTASGLRGLEEVELVEKVIRLIFTNDALLGNILDDGKPVR